MTSDLEGFLYQIPPLGSRGGSAINSNLPYIHINALSTYTEGIVDMCLSVCLNIYILKFFIIH